MEQKNKRSRSINYTSEEKQTLLNLISKYKYAVENKKTDAVSNDQKNAAWKKIADEFNATSPSLQPRTLESIKKFFENKKKEVRKEVAEEKKAILLTGGGPPPNVKRDPNQEVILSIMDKSSVYGGENNFDSDSVTVVVNQVNAEVPLHVYEIETEEFIQKSDQTKDCARSEMLSELDAPTTSTYSTEMQNHLEGRKEHREAKTNWKKSTPRDLQTPISSPLRLRRPSSTEELPTPKKTKFDVSRRRPATQVKALTTSEIASKYNILMDRRLEVADLMKQSLLLDIELKKKQLEKAGQSDSS